MKRLLTASILIFASGCGGGGSTQAPPVDVGLPCDGGNGEPRLSGQRCGRRPRFAERRCGGRRTKRRDASASTAIWTGYLVNHNDPRPTVADVEYAYPVFTGSGFSGPEARRSNDVPCNGLGAVAMLRTHGVRLVHDEIASAGRRSRKLIDRASDSELQRCTTKPVIVKR
jgi:hypothetical protein